ncbi:hypothetical protein BDZ45DRAFT_145987 [Acephala macrosclerotiorum]|nr:hypothetical protein BDZ45DRAFT_145987 [Acephala macrosclerotiorum]
MGDGGWGRTAGKSSVRACVRACSRACSRACRRVKKGEEGWVLSWFWGLGLGCGTVFHGGRWKEWKPARTHHPDSHSGILATTTRIVFTAGHSPTRSRTWKREAANRGMCMATQKALKLGCKPY